MNQLKLVLLSMLIIILIVIIPVFLLIVPTYEKLIYLNKEEEILASAEKKYKSFSEAIVENSRNIRFLEEKIQENKGYIFIEASLNASQVLIDTIKPDQGSEHDELHLMLKAEYAAFINFIMQISRHPNANVLTGFSIEKNRIEVAFKENYDDIIIQKPKRYSSLSKRFATALTPVKIPQFQPSIFLIKNEGPFQSLENIDWHLSGEVRKDGQLLGVFLEGQNQAQTRYFGVDLPWENSDWRVVNITPHEVIFEQLGRRVYWRLSYESPR